MKGREKACTREDDEKKKEGSARALPTDVLTLVLTQDTLRRDRSMKQ